MILKVMIEIMSYWIRVGLKFNESGLIHYRK